MLSARQLSGRTAIILLTAAGIAILLLILWFGRSLFLLAFAGVLLAVVLRSVTDFLSQHLHLPDALALAITGIALLSAVVGFVLLVAPNVQTQAKELWQQLPQTLHHARVQLQQHAWGRRLLTQLPSAGGLVSNGTDFAQHSMQVAFGVLGILGNAVVIAFVGLYLAVNPQRYTRGAIELFPPAWRTQLSETLNAAGAALRRWLIGKLLLMIFVGISTAIGLFALGVPLVLPLALLAAVLDFIPNIGPVLSAVPAVMLALTVGPYRALWVAALYLAVQVIESYILAPFVQGKALSLAPAVAHQRASIVRTHSRAARRHPGDTTDRRDPGLCQTLVYLCAARKVLLRSSPVIQPRTLALLC